MEYKDTIIQTVKEYLDWLDDAAISSVTSVTGNEFDFEHPILYYRGQNCIKDLNPGIFRDPFSPGVVEHEMLHKASLHLWKELSSCSSFLEKLVFLQHYGMPTRLLDVTFNPLIALYFACNGENDCEGAVYCGFQQSAENEAIAEMTSEYVFKQPFDYFEKEIGNFAVKKEMALIKFCQPIFILPPINNPRIEHQNGAFIMAPLANRCDNDVYLNSAPLDDSGFFSEKRAIIPNICKQSIIKDLYKFGINKGNIYQGILEKIDSIILGEKWELERYKLNLN